MGKRFILFLAKATKGRDIDRVNFVLIIVKVTVSGDKFHEASYKICFAKNAASCGHVFIGKSPGGLWVMATYTLAREKGTYY